MIYNRSDNSIQILYKNSDYRFAPKSYHIQGNSYTQKTYLDFDDTGTIVNYNNPRDISQDTNPSWRQWVKNVTSPFENLRQLFVHDNTALVYYERTIKSQKISIPLYITRYGIYNGETKRPLVFLARSYDDAIIFDRPRPRVTKIYMDIAMTNPIFSVLKEFILQCFFDNNTIRLGYNKISFNEVAKLEICDLIEKDIYNLLRLGTLRLELTPVEQFDFFNRINVV